MSNYNPAGIAMKREKKEVFKAEKAPNGVTIYRSETPHNSDSHVALYKFNKQNKLIIACVEPHEVDEALKSLEVFHYKDAQAMLKGTLTVKDYAKTMGFEVSDEDLPEIEVDAEVIKKVKKGKKVNKK